MKENHNMDKRVFIRKISDDLERDIRSLLLDVEMPELLKENTKVFIKLNLSSINPETMKCANTD